MVRNTPYCHGETKDKCQAGLARQIAFLKGCQLGSVLAGSQVPHYSYADIEAGIQYANNLRNFIGCRLARRLTVAHCDIISTPGRIRLGFH